MCPLYMSLICFVVFFRKNESGGIDQTKLENGVPTDQEEDQENPVRKRFPITSDVSFKGKIKNRKVNMTPEFFFFFSLVACRDTYLFMCI